ncbi:MAG: hypothetical protein Q8891_08610 [Bacteroidota bacterium]|nr:hypothetical protein [Bacteroidota bacterium]
MMTHDFETMLHSINRCYSKVVSKGLPSVNDFKNGELIKSGDILHKSVALRIDALNELRKARDTNTRLNLKDIWSKISESIKILPVEATISSIGSQGFLSIPLFKYDTDIKAFEFIRLHIWDASLDKYVNTKTRDNFSVHSHLFQADSWVLCGQIINDRYIVEASDTNEVNSFFGIEYNGTLNEINQHTSTAQRTNTFAKAKQISHEIYMQEGNYSIRAGEFHKSDSNDKFGISATLFSFTSDNNFQGPSCVIGPSNIESSEINRKDSIYSKELIIQIDERVNL